MVLNYKDGLHYSDIWRHCEIWFVFRDHPRQNIPILFLKSDDVDQLTQPRNRQCTKEMLTMTPCMYPPLQFMNNSATLHWGGFVGTQENLFLLKIMSHQWMSVNLTSQSDCVSFLLEAMCDIWLLLFKLNMSSTFLWLSPFKTGVIMEFMLFSGSI